MANAANGMVIAAMIVFTLGEILIIPAEYAQIDQIAPPRMRGTYYGAQSVSELGNFRPIIRFRHTHHAVDDIPSDSSHPAVAGGVFCRMTADTHAAGVSLGRTEQKKFRLGAHEKVS